MGRARLLLLVPLLGVLTSCGAAETGPAPEHAEDWGIHYPRTCPLDLPEATHARWDRDAREHLLVCLTAGGDVWFEGGPWDLATGSDEERQAALDLFEAALRDRVDPAQRPTLRLQVDGDARWIDVQPVLRVAARVAGPDDPVLWNVASAATFRRVHQAVRILPLPPGSPKLPTVEIHARPPPDGADLRVEMELVVDGESAGTTEEHEYEESGTRAFTRAAWRAATARWGTRIGAARGARLRIVDEGRDEARRHVRWGHVVQVLDLLWGLDARTVELPGSLLRLELVPPEDLGDDPFVFPDDPVATPVAVFLATSMVLAAFALTLLPLRGLRRSARKRPTRP